MASQSLTRSRGTPTPLLEPCQTHFFRINVGGKLLTNHLKELISFRYFNMLDETYIINQLKEDVSFVSTSFSNDLQKEREEWCYTLDYILPDFLNRTRGCIRTEGTTRYRDDQILQMGNERFTIPEILFHPSDIGIRQAGICEAIVQCLSELEEEVGALMTANIIVMGGNVEMKGFRERVYCFLLLLYDLFSAEKPT